MTGTFYPTHDINTHIIQMNHNETEVEVIESQSRTCSDCNGIGMIKVR